MKSHFIVVATILALGVSSQAHADATSATASQESAATSTAQGTIQFSQEPEHTTQTVRNVSAPVLGAYASSFSQMNCSSTVQVGGAIAGVSLVGGASRDSQTCVLEVAAAELSRQSTIDALNADQLRRAAINVRCQISDAVYDAMRAAGFACALKPKDMASRTDTQPANYRVAGN
jgi:hypothetical protein